jgi:hypothetical protein
MTDSDYGEWVGRQSSRSEVISDRLLTHFRAVVAGMLERVASLLIQD